MAEQNRMGLSEDQGKLGAHTIYEAVVLCKTLKVKIHVSMQTEWSDPYACDVTS